LDGLEVKEISFSLGLSENAVNVRLSRARKSLASNLENN
jgi:DNA-directed RNA polymerase specialized sigma24 family protein